MKKSKKTVKDSSLKKVTGGAGPRRIDPQLNNPLDLEVEEKSSLASTIKDKQKIKRGEQSI